jgi:hypothetical protein
VIVADLFHRVEEYALDRGFGIVVDNSVSTKHFIRYVCCGRSAGKEPNCCQFRFEAKVSQRLGTAVVTTVFVEHNNYCALGGLPVPSRHYLQNHADLLAYAVENRPNQVIKYALLKKFVVSKTYASDLCRYAKSTRESLYAFSYQGILPYLVECKEKNPEFQFKFARDNDDRFLSAAVLLPGVLNLIKYSFLGTLHIDAGHSVCPDGFIFCVFILSAGDREHRNRPISYGFYHVESAENYKDFLRLLMLFLKSCTICSTVVM